MKPYLLCTAIMLAACAPSRTATLPHATHALLPICADSATDSDSDGVADACEFEIARRFAPLLNASGSACNVVHTTDGDRLGGGYLYAVARTSDGGMRIAYLPAYFQDCGWHGAKCHLPGVDCAPHAGDSEFIVVDVDSTDHGWLPSGVFLSAHCFGKSVASCRWYRGSDLAEFDWPAKYTAGPMVWVANGRNANYPTRGACERGHWWIDTCAGERTTYVFPVEHGLNIGSRVKPASERGCIPADTIDQAHENTTDGTMECMWDPNAEFRGWQRVERGVTAYSRYLQVFAGM
jgi:hypothetical protein